MIASIENVRQFLKDCLAVDDLQAYDCCKIMSEKYGVLTCETINDYARLECIKWMLEKISGTSYVNTSFIYATWFMIREITMNLKTLMDIWSKNKQLIRQQLASDFKKMYNYDPLEYSKCLNSEGYSSLSDHMIDIIYKVYNNILVNADIVDEKECSYYINSCY